MDLNVAKIGDITVVAVPVNELDASNAKDFKNDVATVLDSQSKVILDLQQLRFIDSSGLGAILSCLRQLNAKGGDLKLCGMSRQVRNLFEVVRMHKIFDIHSTREEAVRAFQ